MFPLGEHIFVGLPGLFVDNLYIDIGLGDQLIARVAHLGAEHHPFVGEVFLFGEDRQAVVGVQHQVFQGLGEELVKHSAVLFLIVVVEPPAPHVSAEQEGHLAVAFDEGHQGLARLHAKHLLQQKVIVTQQRLDLQIRHGQGRELAHLLTQLVAQRESAESGVDDGFHVEQRPGRHTMEADGLLELAQRLYLGGVAHDHQHGDLLVALQLVEQGVHVGPSRRCLMQ